MTRRRSEQRPDERTHGLGPTRARVLALLQDAGSALAAAEVADRLGLHPNSARFHLDALTDAGSVTREAEQRGRRGRPRFTYTAAAESPRVAGRSYRLLAELLADLVVDTVPDPAVRAEQAGRAWSRALAEAGEAVAGADATQALAVLVEELGEVGFDSHVAGDEGARRVDITHCPFLEVAESRQDVVCAMHLGLMRGLLEEQGSPVGVTALEPLVEPSLCVARLTG